MRALRNTLLIAVAAGVSFAASRPDAHAIEAPTVEVQLGEERVRLGESLGVAVIVRGTQDAEPPEDAAFGEDFDAEFQTARPMQQRSLVIENGVRRESNELSMTFVWIVRPKRAGELEIPSLDVEVEGETLTTEPRRLWVVAPRPSSVAHLHVSVDPQRPTVEQPVTLRLEITLQRPRLGGDFAAVEPWIWRDPLDLRIPWFGRIDGFAAESFDEFQRRLLAGARRPGFVVNRIPSEVPFGGPLLFAPPREELTEDDREWYRWVIEKTVAPLEPGRLELPMSTLYGRQVTEVEMRGGNPVPVGTEDVFIGHEPVVLDVLPVPEEGRPPTYSHAIGRYAVTSTASPTRVQVGDPVTLLVKVTGDGLLGRIQAPRLDLQPDLAADFAIADGPTEESRDGERTFAFTLRPRHADVVEIPPLQYASFDTETRTFHVAESGAIELDVVDASSVALSEVGGGARATNTQSTPGEELVGGLLGNVELSGELRDESYDPRGSLWTWVFGAGPPLLLLIAFVVARRREALLSDPLGRRAAAAMDDAREGLRRARAAFQRGDGVAATEELQRAVTEFVAARTRLPSAGLTAREVADVLAESDADPAITDRVIASLDACETARFGGGAADELERRITDAESDLRALAEGGL